MYAQLKWSTDINNKTIALIGERIFNNEELIKLRDELILLLKE